MIVSESEVREGYRMTELGELPEEWEASELSHHLELNDSGVWGDDPEESQGVEVLRSTNMQDGQWVFDDVAVRAITQSQRERCTLREGDVLITKSSGSTQHIGKSAYADSAVDLRQACFSNFMQRLRFGSRIFPRFMFYYLLGPGRLQLLTTSTTTTGLRNLRKSDFGHLLAPLPPISEQKKIAAVLQTVQQAKGRTEAVIQAARELKKSLLHYLFTYGPVPVSQAEDVELKETEIGAVPDHWEVVKMEDIIADGPQNGLYKPASSYGSGTPIIRIDAFNEQGHFVSLDFKRVRLEADEIERFRVSEGDILINRVNSIPQLGKAVLIPDFRETTVFESNMMRLRVDSNIVSPQFIASYLTTPACRSRLQGMARQAVGQSSINQGDVKSLLLPLPPLSEQQTVVNMISASEMKIAAEHDHRCALEKLFNTLLNDLMTARIRVNDLELGEVDHDEVGR